MKDVITFKTKGDLKKTLKFLRFISSRLYLKKIEHYAKKGVVALIEATPKESGETADAWDYEIQIDDKRTRIAFTNSNIAANGTPVVVLIQYGHATRNGGWVEGFDFVNPAVKPIFDEMAEDIWKEVQNA
jgi:hypothetical protein